MKARQRSYDHEQDFARVRAFLANTYASFDAPVNWGIERWNYARYFVAPMLGSYGTDTGTPDGSLKAIALWEDLVRIWEDERSAIVGVTCIEHPDPTHDAFGEIFVQRHPDHIDLLEEMLIYGETYYVHPERNRVYIWVYDDDEDLLDAVKRRGYERREEPVANHLDYVFDDLGSLELPTGYRLISMAEENDIEKRREIFGRGFNHEDPKDWPSTFAYRELQKAPDYRKEHDLVIVAPDGTYAACCIVWYDEVNRVGHLEPLGTHPDHRRKGLATQLQFEGMRRLRKLGATHMPMTGGFEPFYLAVGFRKQRITRPWIKTF